MDKILDVLKIHREHFPGPHLSTIGGIALQGAVWVYSEESIKKWLKELDKILEQINDSPVIKSPDLTAEEIEDDYSKEI